MLVRFFLGFDRIAQCSFLLLHTLSEAEAVGGSNRRRGETINLFSSSSFLDPSSVFFLRRTLETEIPEEAKACVKTAEVTSFPSVSHFKNYMEKTEREKK